ncbi:MAG: ATP-binding protein [Myxococcota bacterium]
MSSFVKNQIAAIVSQAERLAEEHPPAALLGDSLAALARPLIANRDVPLTAVLRLALLNDCLRITERTLLADGMISDAELDYAFPLISSVTPLLARLRASYGEFVEVSPATARHFLSIHNKDGQPFGGRCERTAWSGFEACRQLSRTMQSPGPIRDYESLVVRLVDDLAALGGRSAAEEAMAESLRTLIAEQTRIPDLIEETPEQDGRAEAFCAPDAIEVFHAVAHAEQLWKRDPFDVEAIHAEARRVFDDALERVRDADSAFGRTLVVLGSSGAGKTHLLRALRAAVHGRSAGFVGYVQMGSTTRDVPRLLLSRLVDSLERAYDEPMVSDSALSCLSDALLARMRSLVSGDVSRLRDGELTSGELERFTQDLASTAMREGLGELHADVVRAFLLLQRRDPAIRQRVLKFLRCERLSRYEQDLLGDIVSWTDDDAPRRMLSQLGRLTWTASRAALVLLIDQLEDLQQQDATSERFVSLMDCLRAIGDDLPHSVTVLACLEDFYVAHEKQLSKAVRDRLDRDPEPVRLTADRRLEEIHAMVAQRLEVLYASQNVSFREDEPLFPFASEQLARMRNTRSRAVLEWCGEYQKRCRLAGELVDLAAAPPPSVEKPAGDVLHQAWERHGKQDAPAAPGDDASTLELICWAAAQVARETRAALACDADAQDALVVSVEGQSRLFLGLANQAPQGGHLGRQVLAMKERADAAGAELVLMRHGEFPNRPKTKIARTLGELLKQGARKAVLVEAELRQLTQARAFLDQHANDPGIADWSARTRLVAGSPLMKALLGSVRAAAAKAERDTKDAESKASKPSRSTPPVMPSTPPPPQPSAGDLDHIVLGRGQGLRGQTITLPREALARHGAVLGATGSGKTTLALLLIEQLLLAGIPALLVDRKGDLCTYADPSFWEADEPDATRAARKRALRDKVDVHLYTPGAAAGRPLHLPLAPREMSSLPTADRAAMATEAAAALGAMLGFKMTPSEGPKLGILAKAVELLSEQTERITIDDLIEPIATMDADLVNAVGVIGGNHFKILAERLQSAKLLNANLFDGRGEELSGDLLFGRDGSLSPGKVRLTVISTKGLRNDSDVEFWIARLLSEIAGWANRNPQQGLQAVTFFDEADLYLPATRKPVTKEPMISLLKRGRSAGVGVVLGTQNPGDFDYKARGNINAWFVGRISQSNDVDKMRALLAEARTDISSKLANAEMGQFYLLREGQVAALRADRSVMATRQLSEEEILRLASRGR